MKLASYSAGAFGKDLFGGLTAGIVALPLSLAFGVACGAGPAAGLYGAIALGFFAAVLGGTPTQISGPTGPMTVVTASAMAAFAGDYQLALAVVVLAGAFQILFGVLKIGTFVKFMPYPVISGFMTGIGVIIILLQLPPLLGAPAVSSPVAALMAMGDAVPGINMQAALLSGATLAIVILCPARVTRVVPSPLIALVAMTILSVKMGFEVATIGSVPSGFPMTALPGFDIHQTGKIVGYGLALAVLGSIDSLLTSIVADSLTKTRHDSNRELIGQGVGNMLAGLVGGVPGAGATMRTVVNIKAGGTTRVSGAVHALVLLALVLGLGPMAEKIPMCVLAAILVKVGIDILDYRMLALARKAPAYDFAVMLVVLVVTVFVDLMVAVGVGVTLASLLITYRIAKRSQVNIMEAPNGVLEREAERAVQDQTGYLIRVVDIRGPFFFGSATQMQDKIDAMLGTKVVVFNCLEVPFMDLSAMFALDEAIERLKSQGVEVILAVTPKQRLDIGKVKISARGIHMFATHEAALSAARALAGVAAGGGGASLGHGAGREREGRA